MVVSSLAIDHFRNLRRVEFGCAPGLNLIVGANASGKTSLLEALYFLGRLRSFRTRQPRELIGDGEEAFRIVARMRSAAGGRTIPIGIERSTRSLTARIDGAPADGLARLAALVPVLRLGPDSHRLLDDGPRQRRRFMDWGLFHADGTEQAFLRAWRRYGAALRQRNAALRAGFADRGIEAWNEELAGAAATLDRLRGGLCAALEQRLEPLVQALLGRDGVGVDYRRGWSRERDLMEALDAAREQDRRCGFTRAGPHRADFAIRLGGQPISQCLSRGQQKLLLVALLLAQAQLYRSRRGEACILLIDDLPAELDRHHRDRMAACLAEVEVQLFVTAIEPDLLAVERWSEVRRLRLRDGALEAEGRHPCVI